MNIYHETKTETYGDNVGQPIPVTRACYAAEAGTPMAASFYGHISMAEVARRLQVNRAIDAQQRKA